MAFSQYFTTLWSRIKQASTFVPAYFRIPDENTDLPSGETSQFDERRHYFMISVNEMYLSYKREWHKSFSPMVFSVCNFKYDGKELEIPFAISPGFLQKYKQEVPGGMLFLNTPVVGLFPWRGGNVSLSLILSRIPQADVAEKMIDVIGEISGSLSFAAGIESYTRISRVLLNGINSLMGFQQTQPILGVNNNFGMAAGNPFRPGYHALIHSENPDKKKFWVKENALYYGNSLESAIPYRDDDYVLFRIGISDKRHDLESLSFYKEYREIFDFLEHQDVITHKEKELLRPKILHLAVAIKRSPDLTWEQANQIHDTMIEDINLTVEKFSKLDGEHEIKGMNQTDTIMDETLQMLKF